MDLDVAAPLSGRQDLLRSLARPSGQTDSPARPQEPRPTPSSSSSPQETQVIHAQDAAKGNGVNATIDSASPTALGLSDGAVPQHHAHKNPPTMRKGQHQQQQDPLRAYLDAFADALCARAQGLQEAVRSLEENAYTTATDLDAVRHRFALLSHSQFIQNSVQDDDDDDVLRGNSNPHLDHQHKQAHNQETPKPKGNLTHDAISQMLHNAAVASPIDPALFQQRKFKPWPPSPPTSSPSSAPNDSEADLDGLISNAEALGIFPSSESTDFHTGNLQNEPSPHKLSVCVVEVRAQESPSGHHTDFRQSLADSLAKRAQRSYDASNAPQPSSKLADLIAVEASVQQTSNPARSSMDTVPDQTENEKTPSASNAPATMERARRPVRPSFLATNMSERVERGSLAHPEKEGDTPNQEGVHGKAKPFDQNKRSQATTPCQPAAVTLSERTPLPVRPTQNLSHLSPLSDHSQNNAQTAFGKPPPRPTRTSQLPPRIPTRQQTASGNVPLLLATSEATSTFGFPKPDTSTQEPTESPPTQAKGIVENVQAEEPIDAKAAQKMHQRKLFASLFDSESEQSEDENARTDDLRPPSGSRNSSRQGGLRPSKSVFDSSDEEST